MTKEEHKNLMFTLFPMSKEENDELTAGKARKRGKL